MNDFFLLNILPRFLFSLKFIFVTIIEMTESPGLNRRNQTSINNYFVVCDDGRKKCTNCDAKYSKNSGNSTLRSHLESKHKIKLILTQEDENVYNDNAPKG
jgi:hypothetical protein